VLNEVYLRRVSAPIVASIDVIDDTPYTCVSFSQATETSSTFLIWLLGVSPQRGVSILIAEEFFSSHSSKAC
jgi:hypothetical protein